MFRKAHFEELDSTSTYLKKNYLKYDNMTFISASYQTNGHGRNNRNWHSNPKENLLFSILIKDKNSQKIIKYDLLKKVLFSELLTKVFFLFLLYVRIILKG